MQISESQPEGFANPGTDGRFYINAPHGTGVVDFDALIDTIRKSGYDDTLAIEYVPIPGADPAEDMKRVYDMFSEKI